MRFLALLALTLLQAAAPQPRASIQGTVFRADSATGERLADARVELHMELLDGREMLPTVTRTDGAGQFAFTNLAAGTYRVKAGKDGFLRQELGAVGPGVPGTLVSLTATQQADIAFRLEVAPTLTGRVTDESGEPMPNVLIEALRSTYDPRGVPIFVPQFFARSDDTGQYRLFWIDPGDYYISAWAGGEELEEIGVPPNPNKGARRFGYPPVYHTGVTDPEGMVPLPVAVAAEIEGLDFRLTRGTHHAVGGVVYFPGEEKTFQATVSLFSAGSVRTAERLHGRVGRDGSFKIGGVTPGIYRAVARSESGQSGAVQIEVTREDIFNLRIDTAPPVRIKGNLFAESTAPIDIRKLRVQLTPLDPGTESKPAAKPESDGSFVFPALDKGNYMVEVSGLPGDTYLKAARYGETDPLKEGLAVAGPAMPALGLLIGFDGGHLHGTARTTADEPAAGAQVVLVPDASRRGRPDQYRALIADARGDFTLSGIPPGAYTLLAWDRVEPRAWLNAEFLQNYLGSGMTIQIAPGANRDSTIHLAVRGNTVSEERTGASR